MTGFGVLYYTDCRPGQGLNGSAGFQFQAASQGLATEAMPLVQRSLLYEPPAAWMRERRPPAEYPRSLTHTVDDGIYATAAGCYLGQEANGSRQGNQFTHAVVTRNAKAYGFLRPAQLWGASWWATTAAVTTELPERSPGPEGGPLEAEVVRDRVRDTPGGEERLIALLSAVERLADPELRQKVVVISEDPELAACWIAAATVLLPQPRALQVGFKIFVADAQYARHDIVALHPEWAGRWADTSEGQGLAVFDLDQQRHTRTEATEAARFWVPRFLEADDPLDIVDTVDLAGAIAHEDAPASSETGAERLVAASGTERLVAAVIQAGEPLSRPEQLERVSSWLVKAPEEAAKKVRGDLVDAVLAAGPDIDVLRSLALAIGSRDWGDAKATVRDGLLAAEIEEAEAAPDGVAAAKRFQALPKLTPYESDTAVNRLVLALEGVQRGDQVPALLAVASRHGARLATNDYRREAYFFAEWWVANTGTPQTAGLLDCLDGPEPLDWVRDVLREQLCRHDSSALMAVRSYWWEYLWRDARDPDDPLHKAVVQAAYRRLAEGTARSLVGRAQDDGVTHHAADPGAAAWDMVFGDEQPNTSQARDFMDALQARRLSVSAPVASRLAQVCEAESEVSDDSLWLSDQLTQLGVPLSPRVVKFHKAEHNIKNVLNALRKGSTGWASSQIADVLNNTPSELLGKRLDAVVGALVGARRETTAVHVLQLCDRDVLRPVLRVLTDSWPGDLEHVSSDDCRVLAFGCRVFLARAEFRDDRQPELETLGRRLELVIMNADKSVLKWIQKQFPADLSKPWGDWVDELRAGRLKKMMLARKRSDDVTAENPKSSDSTKQARPAARKGRGPGKGGRHHG